MRKTVYLFCILCVGINYWFIYFIAITSKDQQFTDVCNSTYVSGTCNINNLNDCTCSNYSYVTRTNTNFNLKECATSYEEFCDDFFMRMHRMYITRILCIIVLVLINISFVIFVCCKKEKRRLNKFQVKNYLALAEV